MFPLGYLCTYRIEVTRKLGHGKQSFAWKHLFYRMWNLVMVPCSCHAERRTQSQEFSSYLPGWGPFTLALALAFTPQIPVNLQACPVSLPAQQHSEEIPSPLPRSLSVRNPLGRFPFHPLPVLQERNSDWHQACHLTKKKNNDFVPTMCHSSNGFMCIKLFNLRNNHTR